MDVEPSPTTVDSHYDWEATSPSTAIVETVAVATDEPPLEMPPLYAQIDPEALNTLVSDEFCGPDGSLTRVTFEYADTRVTVLDRGRVVVDPEANTS